jgi:DNA-directed RNA polymerase specialized sigma24 family protein
MKNEGTASQPELLLSRWLAEHDTECSQREMETLVSLHAEPLVRRIVAFKLGSCGATGSPGLPHADVEDVCQNALCQLLARLERMKRGDGGAAVRDFSAYVAVTAYNACNAYFRSKRPAWLSLSMKIRYVASHSSKFALWDNRDGLDVCGLTGQRGEEAPGDAAHLARACADLRTRIDASRLPVQDLMEQLLRAVGRPLLFDTLVDAAADLSGLREDRMESLHEPNVPEQLADTAQPADVQLIDRHYIRLVWKEIAALPLEHRRALLLNLSDSAGGDIRMFDSLGIASVRDIAALLEMEPLQFADLWKDLPLDDARVAQMLGISRQDVANRRSSARKRLARRLQEIRNEV